MIADMLWLAGAALACAVAVEALLTLLRWWDGRKGRT